MNRRGLIMAGAAAALLPGRAAALPPVEVYKSPSCGCCAAWIDHISDAGFGTSVHDVDYDALDALKARLGIEDDIMSCHTALVGGYFLEGHVPAGDVQRLLAERPQALGLAVPGMPMGAPGMEMGGAVEPYDTLLVKGPGLYQVFASHG